MPPFVIITDPMNNDCVLARPDIFVKGSFWDKNCHDIFGDALIDADGDSWRTQRRAGARFLTKARVRHLVEDVLPQQYDDTVEVALTKAERSGTTVDMQSIFNLLTTRAMSHLAFDTKFDSMSPYCLAFEYAQDLMGDRFQDPLWSLTHLLRFFRRLHPPVPFDAKECTEEVTLPDGIVLPAGCIIGWSIYAMGRAREIWGEDAKKWKPERWIRGADVLQRSSANIGPEDSKSDAAWHIHEPSPSRFPVFHGGPRACLGQGMAEAEAVWTICRVLQEWDLEAMETLEDARCMPSGLTMPKLGGSVCRARRRSV